MKLAKDSQILVLQPFAHFGHQISSISRVHGLISEIIQDEEGHQNHEDTMEISSSYSSTSHIPWHISNKYYDADVAFKLSSISIVDSSPQKRMTRTRRAAQMVNASKISSKSSTVAEDDEELKRRVRNVFEALDKPAGTFKPKEEKEILHADKRKQLANELSGIDAVMMIIDPSQPLRQHQQLLIMLNSPDGTKEEGALLSGFNLAVSIVIALSSPLEEGTFDQKPRMEQLSDLYTGEGWEFIDLEDDATGSEVSIHCDADEEEDDEGRSHSLGEVELQGISRVREALQTHTWPNLIRKDGRMAIRQSDTNKRSSSQSPAPFTGKEEEIERAMALLQMDLGALDAESETIPTQQDEELAKAFLKRILASQVDDVSPRDTGTKPPSKSLESMQAELETFLESEDTEWPVSTINRPNAGQDEDAWSTIGLPTAFSKTSAFDDDFSDFVKGSVGINLEEESSATDARPDAIDTELDLDDLAFLKALDKGHTSTKGVYNGIDFESSLSAIIAQAERVRSINDHQKRREEAARIALTLSGEEP